MDTSHGAGRLKNAYINDFKNTYMYMSGRKTHNNKKRYRYEYINTFKHTKHIPNKYKLILIKSYLFIIYFF